MYKANPGAGIWSRVVSFSELVVESMSTRALGEMSCDITVDMEHRARHALIESEHVMPLLDCEGTILNCLVWKS